MTAVHGQKTKCACKGTEAIAASRCVGAPFFLLPPEIECVRQYTYTSVQIGEVCGSCAFAARDARERPEAAGRRWREEFRIVAVRGRNDFATFPACRYSKLLRKGSPPATGDAGAWYTLLGRV
jgi:hypothetical protein